MIRTSALIALCRRVGISLQSGVDMRRIWDNEASRGTGRYRTVMEEIRRRIHSGDTMADAFRDSRFFPETTTAMVDIGEHTGRSHEALLKLAEHYEHQQRMQSQFLGGIAWPALQLIFAVVIVGLLIYAMGIIGAVTGSKPIDITGLGLTGTRGMLIYFASVGAMFASLGITLYALSQGAFGPWPVMAAMQIPVIGPVFRYMSLSRLTWALAMSLDAGIDALRSVELAIRATQNPYFMSRIASARTLVRRGDQFYEIFQGAGGFPEEFLRDMETAEIAGTLSESLVRMSKQYDESARTWIQRLTYVASMATWLAVMVIMVALIFMLFTKLYLDPINNLMNDLKV